MKSITRIALYSVISLALATGSACKNSGKKDQSLAQLLMLGYLAGQNAGGLQIVYDSGYHNGATASTMSFGSMSVAASGSPLTNMEGLTIDQYGDGTGDGYADRFLTPIEVSFVIGNWIGYLPESQGGPPHGQETVSNGEVIFSSYDPGAGQYDAGNLPYYWPLIAGQTAATSRSLDNGYYMGWSDAFLGPPGRYDRFGLEIAEIVYVFDSHVTKESYRWIGLYMGKHPVYGWDRDSATSACGSVPAAVGHSIIAYQRFGDGTPPTEFPTLYDLFYKIQYEYFATNYSYYDTSYNDWGEMPEESDATNVLGKSMRIPGLDSLAAWEKGKHSGAPNSYTLNYLPENAPALSTGECSSSLLTFSSPVQGQGNGFRIVPGVTGEMMVFDVPPSSFADGRIPKITLTVDPTNVLFWDSDRSDDGTFDPALDAPGSKAGKDIKFHLPVVGITVE